MSRAPGLAPWIPPLAVGVAAAVAGELSVALLLYAAAGFLHALTLILVVELAALALGLWSAPTPEGPGWEAVRRRWLLALVAFTVAAGVAAGWDLAGGLASRGALRGLGLALLAALPLYAAGNLLGVMAAIGPGDGPAAPVAAPAALGAAVGAALMGLLGPRLPPVSAFLGCVVLLSGASLVHGRVLDRRTRVRVLARGASSRGPLRVEERLPSGGPRQVVVLEGRVVRAGRDDTGRPVRAWEEGASLLLQAAGAMPSLLVVGAGAVGVARRLPRGTHGSVVEPDPAFGALLAEHLTDRCPGDGDPGGDEAPVAAGGPGDPGDPQCPRGPCDLTEGFLPAGAWTGIVLDATAWGGREPVPLLPRRTLAALRRRLAPGGLLLVGGARLGGAGASSEGLTAFHRAVRDAGFGEVGAYAPHDGGSCDGLVAVAAPGPHEGLPSPPSGWRRFEPAP